MPGDIVGLRGQLGNLIQTEYGRLIVPQGGWYPSPPQREYPPTWIATTAKTQVDRENPGLRAVSVAYPDGIYHSYIRGYSVGYDFALPGSGLTLVHSVNYWADKPGGINYYLGKTAVPVVFWDDEPRELQAFIPLIKVYSLDSNAVIKGLSYGWRRVKHRLVIDIKCRDDANCQIAKEEILRILGLHRMEPFTGYNVMTFDFGTQRAGYSGFYWWIIEVTILQVRKPVAT
jgi:hypothetical protein